MEKRGYGRKIGEGPINFASRLRKSNPEMRREIDAVTSAYVQNNYVDEEPMDLASLKKAVRAITFKSLAVG